MTTNRERRANRLRMDALVREYGAEKARAMVQKHMETNKCQWGDSVKELYYWIWRH